MLFTVASKHLCFKGSCWAYCPSVLALQFMCCLFKRAYSQLKSWYNVSWTDGWMSVVLSINFTLIDVIAVAMELIALIKMINKM